MPISSVSVSHFIILPTPVLIAEKDRDPTAWSGFSAQEIQRRRTVFWMLYMTDAAEVSDHELVFSAGVHWSSHVESRYWETSQLPIGFTLHRYGGSRGCVSSRQ
jgi:hypothetical protein